MPGTGMHIEGPLKGSSVKIKQSSKQLATRAKNLRRGRSLLCGMVKDSGRVATR